MKLIQEVEKLNGHDLEPRVVNVELLFLGEEGISDSHDYGVIS